MVNTGVFDAYAEIIRSTNADLAELLTPTNLAEAQAEFLSNPELTVPHFEYGKLDPQFVRDALDELDAVSFRIRTDIRLTPLQSTFLALRYSYNARKLRFLKSCLRVQAEGEAMTPETRSSYLRTNSRLYGQPDWETFRTLLYNKMEELERQARQDGDVQRRSACVTLRKQLFDRVISASYQPARQGIIPARAAARQSTGRDFFMPKAETVLRFGDLMRKELERFLRHVPEEQQTFTMAEAYQIVDGILRTELPESRFHAELREGVTNLAILPDEYVVQIPAQRAKGDLTRDDLCNILIGHELGGHMMRSVPFEGSTFGEYWPDSEQFDEGVACCVEQSLRGEFTTRGVFHYLNISCAAFLQMNFREVYDMNRQIRLLDKVPAGQDREDYATRVAFLETRRCFRGTGVLPNFKDLIYYEGSRQVWKFIEDHIREPDYLLQQLFRSGKSDPTNHQHQQFIEALQAGELG